MKNKENFLNLFLTALLVLFVISSCNMSEPKEISDKKENEDEKKEEAEKIELPLTGYWKDLTYKDGFEIFDVEPPVFTQYQDENKDNKCFKGEIVSVKKESDIVTYITIKITESGSYNKTEGEYLTIYIGDFVGNIVGASLKESSAFKQDGKSTMSTKEEAEKEFTIANGYFAFYGNYIKQ